MAEATVRFDLGAETVTVALPVDLPTGGVPLVGDVSGTFGDAHIVGNLNLTGDLIIEDGLLTGVDTFTVEGNGHQILFQNGGRPDLRGVPKTGWLRFGETPTGWLTTDAIRVAPTAVGVFGPVAMPWTGVWGAHPSTAPLFVSPDGQFSIEPEVANLTRSIVFKNLSRMHFHDDAGIAILKHLTVSTSGVTGVLGQYPIHFHLNGEASRGSLVEGVVTLSAKNHAIVAHGSHGITIRDFIAYNTVGEAFWWDPPVEIPPALRRDHTANNSNDILYDHCMSMTVTIPPGNNGFRLPSFDLGAGSGNACVGSVAVCNQGTKDSSGFGWPETANQNVGGNRWDPFSGCVSHNNKADGINVWQNDSRPHVIEDFVAYRNGLAQIDHGAYNNNYDYKRCELYGGTEPRFKYHSWGNALQEDIGTDGPLQIQAHQSDAQVPTIVRRCGYTHIIYAELGNTHSSWMRYEDHRFPLTPANFSMAGAVSSSVAEIYEAGVLTHRWAGGSWQP